MIYLLSLAMGIIAGLRAMTVPAAVSWAAYLGILHLEGTWLAFLGNSWLHWLFTAFAIGELITDQLPTTPSRKVPAQFGTRIVTGAFSGAAIGVAGGSWIVGAVAGAVGAVIGTLGGAAVRGKLAASFGRDLPAALIEDAVAVGGAFLIVAALS
jgi:uncharacterized membrane protein